MALDTQEQPSQPGSAQPPRSPAVCGQGWGRGWAGMEREWGRHGAEMGQRWAGMEREWGRHGAEMGQRLGRHGAEMGQVLGRDGAGTRHRWGRDGAGVEQGQGRYWAGMWQAWNRDGAEIGQGWGRDGAGIEQRWGRDWAGMWQAWNRDGAEMGKGWGRDDEPWLVADRAVQRPGVWGQCHPPPLVPWHVAVRVPLIASAGMRRGSSLPLGWWDAAEAKVSSVCVLQRNPPSQALPGRWRPPSPP